MAVPLRAFYDNLTRILSINGVVGKPFRSLQSVLQGCAWSNPLAAAIDVAWSCYVERQAKVAAFTYADDWYIIADRHSL